MPHFDEHGNDTAICQECGRVGTQERMGFVWQTLKRNPKLSGNVCAKCATPARAEPGPLSLPEYCAQESGFPLGSHQLTQYINRYYGHG